MNEELPDYPRYSLVELLEALTGLDRRSYGDRAGVILRQIQDRYPEAWSVLGERLAQSLKGDQDVPLGALLDALPHPVLAAGEQRPADAPQPHYEDMPDYGAYAASELLQALNSVDHRQYPERQDRLLEEIRRRFPDKLDAARKIMEKRDR